MRTILLNAGNKKKPKRCIFSICGAEVDPDEGLGKFRQLLLVVMSHSHIQWTWVLWMNSITGRRLKQVPDRIRSEREYEDETWAPTTTLCSTEAKNCLHVTILLCTVITRRQRGWCDQPLVGQRRVRSSRWKTHFESSDPNPPRDLSNCWAPDYVMCIWQHYFQSRSVL